LGKEVESVLRNFDHLTIVVRDLERTKESFAVLGFKEAMSVVIAGEPFASYMGVPDISEESPVAIISSLSADGSPRASNFQWVFR
jgi:hypothetical protein